MRPKQLSMQGCLLFASLGFFLPFAAISCQGQKVVEFTGAQLVTGTKIAGGPFSPDTPVPPDLWVVAALVLGIAALLVVFKAQDKMFSKIAIGCSAAAAIALVIFQIEAPDQVRQSTAQALSLDMEIGYWIALLLYIGATVLGVLDMKDINVHKLADADRAGTATSQ